VERALICPRLGFTIGHGISDSRLRIVDDSKAGHIGFHPKDSTEPYRAALEARTDTPDPKAESVQYIGGWFCDLGHPDDEDK